MLENSAVTARDTVLGVEWARFSDGLYFRQIATFSAPWTPVPASLAQYAEAKLAEATEK